MTPEDYTAYLAVDVQSDDSVSLLNYRVQIAQENSSSSIQGAIGSPEVK